MRIEEGWKSIDYISQELDQGDWIKLQKSKEKLMRLRAEKHQNRKQTSNRKY